MSIDCDLSYCKNNEKGKCLLENIKLKHVLSAECTIGFICEDCVVDSKKLIIKI